MRSVADAAGVSISTASLVFSGKGPVAPATAERVRARAAELGFVGPDPVASSLRQGRTGIVAVVLDGRLLHAFRDPFAVSVLDGLAQQLERMSTSLLLVPRRPGATELAAAELATAPVDAVVHALCGPRFDPALESVLARGIPVVGTGGPLDPRVVQVRVDERGASAEATRHLVGLGHTRLAHVSMPLRPRARTRLLRRAEVGSAHAAAGTSSAADEWASAKVDAVERLAGFVDAAGGQAPVVEVADLAVEEAERAGRLLLGVPPGRRPTAVVAQADLLAAGVVRAARGLGLRVPQDVSVVGFDGVALPWLDLELTTVVQDGQAKGRLLGRLVRRLLDGDRADDVDLPVHLRVGASTAPPADRG